MCVFTYIKSKCRAETTFFLKVLGMRNIFIVFAAKTQSISSLLRLKEGDADLSRHL